MLETTQERIQVLAEKLRARGQRLTPQRMAILQMLVTTATHPDIDTIYRQVKQTYPMISLATVYKTLSTLKELGEVRELGFGEGGNRYDARNTAPHPHLVCTQCGKIVDVDVSEFSQLSARVADQSGYSMLDLRLDFFGICPDCQSHL